MGAESTLDAAGRVVGQFGETIHKGKTIRNEADERAVEFALAGDKAQQELNVAAARTGSIFLAGWRPMLGWVCVSAVCYSVVLHPLLAKLIPWLGKPDMEVIMGLLTLLLGNSALRTYEKMKGVQTHSMMSPRERRKAEGRRRRRWWRRDG